MSKNKKADTRHLVHAICGLNIVPVWNEPAVDSGLITQLLFGETVIVIRKKNRQWFRVLTQSCQSEGWVQASQIELIDEVKFEKYTGERALTMEICHPVFNDETSKYIVMGSSLPRFDGLSLKMPDSKYIFNGQAILEGSLEASPDLVTKIARRYLHTPELSGGRSPFGIDAGSFIQNTFRYFGILLPRTPEQQSLYGDIVDFEEQSVEGDVAFCMDADGTVIHAGILLGDGKVIHPSGSVRIDRIDHFGIFNMDIRRYTHKLRFIRRLVC